MEEEEETMGKGKISQKSIHHDRVERTHKMPYLSKLFSAKEPCD